MPKPAKKSDKRLMLEPFAPQTDREPIDFHKLPKPHTKAHLKLCQESVRRPIPVRFPDGSIDYVTITYRGPELRKKRAKKPLSQRDLEWIEAFKASSPRRQLKNNDHARKTKKS